LVDARESKVLAKVARAPFARDVKRHLLTLYLWTKARAVVTEEVELAILDVEATSGLLDRREDR
jgi:hypothetical protein